MDTTTGQTPLEPQAALEQAVVDLLRATPPAGLGLIPIQCERLYDGTPPARMGDFFAAVWYDGQRGSSGQRTHLSETFGVYVTLTVKFTLPPDRWLRHRDFLEKKANAVKALVAPDAQDYRVVRAAAQRAGLRNPATGNTDRAVGWIEGLVFGGFDPIEVKGPDWFSAEGHAVVGAAQRIKFGLARRVQGLAVVGRPGSKG